jgi:rod shape determining protein RodA
MVGAILLMFSIRLFDVKLIQPAGLALYGLSMLLLVAVLFTKPINGSTSWFDIGGFRFQPSELAKTATALTLSYYLSLPEVRLKEWTYKLQAMGIIALPMGLVLLQGDAGSTLVFLSFSLVLFRAGMDAWIYVVGLMSIALFIITLLQENVPLTILELIAILNLLLLRILRGEWLSMLAYAVLGLGFFILLPADTLYWQIAFHVLLFIGLLAWNFVKNWQLSALLLIISLVSGLYISSISYFVHKVLKPHQQERIWVWLKPDRCDPQGALYNLDQSKQAIGSGGWAGKGFLQGERTKLDYVPEQSTDFIFCTVGEEWGFLGSVVLLSLFFFMLWRILFVAEQERMPYTKYYAYSVAGIIFFHVFINIGMTIGLVPVIGIPLPFVSYGGSSLLSFSLMFGILFKLLSPSVPR